LGAVHREFLVAGAFSALIFEIKTMILKVWVFLMRFLVEN
jgi:hypothetical protein